MAACDEAPVAGCGHAAYNGTLGDVGRVPPRGDPTPTNHPHADCGVCIVCGPIATATFRIC